MTQHDADGIPPHSNGDATLFRRLGVFGSRPGFISGLLAAALLPCAGCSLTDVTIAEPDDLVVAEVQVVLTLALDNRNVSLTAWALLHRTYLFGEAPTLAGTVVKVSADSSRVVRLEEQDSLSFCIGENPFRRDDEESEPFPGAVCYRAEAARAPFVPGERLSLEITTPDGRVLTGSSRIPGAFYFTELNHERGRCRMEPDTNYRFRWTAAKDAWAYVADARFEGLAKAFAARNVESPDTVYLGGLSLRGGRAIVFPGNFGLFDFLSANEAERKVIRELRNGLPEGSRATVSIAATDRNWVNWARGGNFNPSGLLRIPSVFGDGTGVFATAPRRLVRVKSSVAGEGEPPLCGPPEP